MDSKDEKPAYVRFERRPVENRAASLEAGHFVGKDEDWVLITPPGSKDCVERLAAGWLEALKVAVKDGRMTMDLQARYSRTYEFWVKGEELPPEGTPIKGWPVLSPAQQKSCIEAANIRTVEDLATANGEAMGRMGMGAVEMKQKAEAWLKASLSLGTVVSENAALKTENATLKAHITALEARNTALAQQIQAQKAVA